jgi:alpha-1,6-mannosyltransferase
LKTIYPPTAQAAFAVSYLAKPWSLSAWRVVCLVGEIATFILMMKLLALVGRSLLWSALYWWNPLVIKELSNSAHMEAIAIPLVLAAIWLAAKNRNVAASGMISLAAGANLWPILLAPVLLRHLSKAPLRLAAALVVTAAIGAAFAWPIFAGGLDQMSGFVAYASVWQTNSALTPALETLTKAISALFQFENVDPAQTARAVLAITMISITAAIAFRPISSPLDLLHRCLIACAALTFLSPAQFPWYMTWMLPLLAFSPQRGLLAVTAFTPLYYAGFHFHAMPDGDAYIGALVWLIWVPVWVLTAIDATKLANGELLAKRSPRRLV